MKDGRKLGRVLACAVVLLAGCKADLKCGPLDVDEERRLCVCPNGGTYIDGLCHLADGSVTPLDAGASDAGRVDACAPTGEERCDGVLDEDCDGAVDEGCACTTGAEMPCGTSDVGACARGIQRCVGGAWAACEGAVEPSAETCNGADDDCDGNVDEDLATSTYYRDADGDGYGSDADTRIACRAPSGYVARGGDCLDGNASVHPGQTSYFTVPITGAPTGREFDYDCDGTISRQHGASGIPCSYNPTLRTCTSFATGFFYNGLDPNASPGPPCGDSGAYRTGCISAGGESCQSISETRTQACR